MDTENRIELGFWNEIMACYVRAWVPVDDHALSVVINPCNSPDMSGCIEIAEKTNKNVKVIFVYAKNKENFFYYNKIGKWYCVNKDWKTVLDIDLYDRICKIGE